MQADASQTDPREPADDAAEGVPQRWRQAFVLLSGVAIIGFLLVQVWLDARADQPRERVKRLMPSIGAEVIDQPLTAEQANWRLETSGGQSMTLAQLPPDRVVFLNFWATWCPPCRDELPSMLRLQSELRDRKFLMLGVSYDEDWGAIREFFMKWRGSMPPREQLMVVRDPAQGDAASLRQRFGTDQIPDTYVLYGGRILARFVNARNWVDPSIMEYFRQLAPPIAALE